ncbi:MAG: hypothetical protein ACK2T3_15760, partial [Candidatus Promineifilaceae bacterium]
MRTSDILIRRRIKPKHLAISLLVLAACLAFPVVFYLDYFDSGFSVNSRWVVIEVTLCDDHPEMCEDSEAELQIGDRITKYAGFTSEDFETNRALSPFGETKPGDIIEISFLRDNVPHVIDWQIPFQNPFTRLIALIAPIFVFGPFWIAGTAILLFMRPRSQQRLLFILMNYLTALWLATGIYSNFRVLYSSL